MLLHRALPSAVFLVLILLAGLGPGNVGASEHGREYSPELLARAERLIDAERASSAALSELRRQLSWYSDELTASLLQPQSRIERLQAQLEVLGLPSGEASTVQESDQLAARRNEIEKDLVRLRSSFAAVSEMQLRAQGLIEDIDSILASRRYDRLLAVGYSPLSPTSWVEALDAGLRFFRGISAELTSSLKSPAQRRYAADQLLSTGVLLVAGILIVLVARPRVPRLLRLILRSATASLSGPASVLASFVSSVLLPSLSVWLIATAVASLRLVENSTRLLDVLPLCAASILGTAWLSGIAFGVRGEGGYLEQDCPRAWRAAFGSSLSLAGWAFATRLLLETVASDSLASEAALAALMFPVLLFGSLTLFKAGRPLLAVTAEMSTRAAGKRIRNRYRRLTGVFLVTLSVTCPLLAIAGMNFSANYLLFSSIITACLYVLAVCLARITQEVIRGAGSGPAAMADGMLEVVTGLAYLVAFAPLVALVWGATTHELQLLWQMAVSGFEIGGQRISLVDIITLLGVLVLGLAATRALQRFLKVSVLAHTRMEAGGQQAIVTGIGYVGICVAAVIAVHLAGINLTNIAIIVGALSVGIGFGLQTVVSNFVCGIILLIERPIKQGDWIVVGDVTGIVERISVRSTIVTTFDRATVILPNEVLISSNVTNWTLTDRLNRITVNVGVAYGSDVEKVQGILSEVAYDCERVLDEPPPEILFREFGKSSLDFQLRVILSNTDDRLAVHSELNYAINARFSQEGIEIPFEQREIWLRSAGSTDKRGPQESSHD